MAIKKSSASQIFTLVLGIAFGLVALAVGFKGVKESADFRTRAKEEGTVIKRWEFNGTTTEGWSRGSVSGGYLRFPVALGETASIQNNTVNASLTSGKKTITLAMSVGPRAGAGIPRCPPNVVCDSDQIATSPSARQPFTAKIVYSSSGNSVTFTGSSDGIVKTYTMVLPDAGPLTISTLQIIFTGGSKPGDLVLVDYIRLNGPIVYATPTGECKTGIASVSMPVTTCPAAQTTKYKFSCYDGYQQTLGDGVKCQLIETFKMQAESICREHDTCTPVKSTPFQPTPTIKTGVLIINPTVYTTPAAVFCSSGVCPAPTGRGLY